MRQALSLAFAVLLASAPLQVVAQRGPQAGAHQFDVAVSGDFRRYASEGVLDYDGLNLRAHALLDHSERLNTDYRLGYEDGAEPPGQNNQFSFPGSRLSPSSAGLPAGRSPIAQRKPRGSWLAPRPERQ